MYSHVSMRNVGKRSKRKGSRRKIRICFLGFKNDGVLSITFIGEIK